MTKEYCVYIHINNINNKVYIGQTCQIPEYRWGSEGQGYKNGNAHFWSAIQKYGWNNFTHKILYQHLSQEEANQLEIDLIQQYNSCNPLFGYNNDMGGDNKSPSIQTRYQQSISAQNRPIVTDETKEKLSKVNKGKKKSQQTKDKMSESAKIREASRKSFKIKVQCINTGEVFNSLREAANWCGLVGTSGIASVCKNGKQITAGVHPVTKEKLKWRYYNDEIC